MLTLRFTSSHNLARREDGRWLRLCRLNQNNKDNYLEVVSTDWRPRIEIIFVKEKGKERKTEIVNIDEFISIKGVRVLGNKLTSKKVKEINILDPLPFNNETLSNNIELEIKKNDKINKNSTDNLNENNMGNQITLEL